MKLADLNESMSPPMSPAPKTWRVGTLVYTSAGLVVIFAWLLWGDFAWSMKERSVAPVLQLLLKKFKASDTMIGLLLGSIPAAISVLVGPVVAYRSDRKRGRLGRRIPYLIVTTPIAALAMMALAFCPMMGAALDRALGTATPGVNVSTLFCFTLFWTIFEIATIAANVVFGGLINDVVPAPVIGRFYGLFRALSLIDGMIFNYFLLKHADTYYRWLFVGIGLLYGVGFMMMCLKVKEGDYPPPPPRDPNRAGGFFAAMRVYCRECFRNPYYRRVFIFMMVAGLSFAPVNLFSITFANTLMKNDRYGSLLAVTYAISLALSYFLGSLADRFHPLRVGMATLVLYAGVTLWGGFNATHAGGFAVALVLHGVLSGVYFTTTASLGQRLFPRANFAQFAAAALAISAVGSVVLGPAVGSFLDWTHHQYRYTYFASSALAVIAFSLSMKVYRDFIALGGPEHYVAPE